MIATLGDYVCKPLVGDKLEAYTFLKDNVYESTQELTDLKVRKLGMLVKSSDVLVVTYKGEVVGACLFRYVSSYVDLIHMFIVKEYRGTRATKLLLYYLLNVCAVGKEVLVNTFDSSTFKNALKKRKSNYVIKPEVAEIAKKVVKNRIVWSD